MSNHFYALIMAGGVGSRLWPLSRQKSPKQVLPLLGEHSMFAMAVERLNPLLAPEDVLVVVGEEQADLGDAGNDARLHQAFRRGQHL